MQLRILEFKVVRTGSEKKLIAHAVHQQSPRVGSWFAFKLRVSPLT